MPKKKLTRKTGYLKWLFPLFLFPLFIWASKPHKYAEIEGQITETDSNQNLIGAQVTLSKRNRIIQTVFTDENGLYKFHKVRAGKYILSINHLYYNPVNQTVKVKIRQQNRYNFHLERNNKVINEIIITNVDSSSSAGEKTEKKAAEIKYKSETAKDEAPAKSRFIATMEESDGLLLNESAGIADYDGKSTDVFEPNGASAGSLTAGELNDFAKFEMWSGSGSTSSRLLGRLAMLFGWE